MSFFKKKQYRAVDAGFLFDRLQDKFNENMPIRDNIFISDRKGYAILSNNEVFKALRNKALFYIPEQRDCDDYARKVVDELKDNALKNHYNGNQPAVGYFWTHQHAWIVWMNESYDFNIADSPNNMIENVNPKTVGTIRFIMV